MKPSRRDKVLTILQQASHEGVNLGTEPSEVADDKPTGWVTGWHLATHGAGLRYAARIFELRHQHGLTIECHIEHRDGSAVPFYRLEG